MGKKFFDFLFAATISAIVTIITVFQEGVYDSSLVLTMSCIGAIAGIFIGIIKMMVVDNKFDKWSLLSYFIGVIVIYISVALGLLFNTLSN